jgi:hypothetical protein
VNLFAGAIASKRMMTSVLGAAIAAVALILLIATAQPA